VNDADKDFIDATALDAEFILSRLRQTPCRRNILLIDACHSGAFFNNNRGIPDGLCAITACGAQQMCQDTPDGGVFTLALVAGLQGAAADADGDGRVSVDELHDFVKERLRSGDNPQTPQKWVWNLPEPIYMTQVTRPVFLSYSRKDADTADRLEKALAAEGLPVWVDREKVQSGSWKQRVTQGLNRARAVVALLTAHSLASDAVEKEIAFAARKQVPIIPVNEHTIEDRDLPDWFALDFAELHRHQIRAEPGDESIKKLAAAIRALRQPGGKRPSSPSVARGRRAGARPAPNRTAR
jgi:hypothetical protein